MTEDHRWVMPGKIESFAVLLSGNGIQLACSDDRGQHRDRFERHPDGPSNNQSIQPVDFGANRRKGDLT